MINYQKWLAAANGIQLTSWEALKAGIISTTKAMWAWLTTNPVGWAILATAAIAATVGIVDLLTVSLEESKEQLKDLKDECNDIESDLKSMNDELKTTVDRMNELAKKDKLTFTEKEEYDNLVKTNNELQRSIDLLELEQKINNQEKNKSFVQTMDISANTNVSMMGTSTDVALKDYVQGQLEAYRTLIADGISEDEKKQVAYLEKYFQDINKEWSEIAKDIQYIRNPTTEDEKAVNEWLDFVNDFQDQMSIAMGGTNAKTNTFNRLVDNWKFDGLVQSLQDLGEQGQVTAEMLDDPKYDKFIQKLVDLGVIDSADNFDLIALAFNNFGDAALDTDEKIKNTTNDIYKLKQATEELQTALDDTFSNQSIIQSAFDKIQEGSSLSADEVRKLIELCPQLATEFVKTADGYTIGADKLIEANDSIVESAKQSLQERADYLKQFINTDYDTNGIDSSYEAKKYNEWQQSVASAKTELEGLELVLSMFGITLEDTDDKISDLTKSTSNLVGKAKTLSSAFAEQKENGKLSADTVLSLIENGYSAALMYDKETGAIKLNTQAYLDLAKAEIQKQRTEIEIAKNDTLQSKLDAERSIVSNLGWEYLETSKAAIEFAKAKELINNANADLSNYDVQIAALNDLENSLGLVTEGLYGDNSKEKPQSVLDFEKEYARRQHEINMGRMKEDEDYYKWLESAAKTAFEGLTDYQDDLWKYEEEVYKGRKQLAEDFYDSQRDYYKNRVSDLEAQIEITTKDSTDNNGNPLNAEEKFAYIRSVYSDILATIQEDINDIVQNGIEGHEDDLKELEQQYEKYVKEMADIFKDEVESEIDYIQDLQDIVEQVYDDKIDKIEAEKKAMEDRYDAEIDKIDSVIDSIESKNKSEKLTNDLIKARQDLEKANRNKRLVFDSSGNQKYVADTKAVSEAQQAVKEAEQAITINKLEEVKKAIEDEKDVLSKSYDNQITELKEQKEQQKTFYENLIKALQDYLNPKQKESNTNVWNTVAGEDGAVKVGNSEMSTSYIDSRISSEDAVKNIYKKMLKNSAWSDTDIDKALKDYDITKLLTALTNNNYKALGVNDVLAGSSVTNAQSYVNNNSKQSVTISIGDVNITNPVGDTINLAKEITKQLPNAVIQEIYRNR